MIARQLTPRIAATVAHRNPHHSSVHVETTRVSPSFDWLASSKSPSRSASDPFVQVLSDRESSAAHRRGPVRAAEGLRPARPACSAHVSREGADPSSGLFDERDRAPAACPRGASKDGPRHRCRFHCCFRRGLSVSCRALPEWPVRSAHLQVATDLGRSRLPASRIPHGGYSRSYARRYGATTMPSQRSATCASRLARRSRAPNSAYRTRKRTASSFPLHRSEEARRASRARTTRRFTVRRQRSILDPSRRDSTEKKHVSSKRRV
jgi:hypothetical protein